MLVCFEVDNFPNSRSQYQTSFPIKERLTTASLEIVALPKLTRVLKLAVPKVGNIASSKSKP